MFCFKCGNQLVEVAVFCQKCGAKQNASESVPQAMDKTDTKSLDNSTDANGEVILGSIGNGIAGKGLAVYNRNLDLTYYVIKDSSGAKIISETNGAKREIFIDKSNSPKYLFTDNNNLYFLLQEGSKIFKKNPMFVCVCPHGSSAFTKLGAVEAEQMSCYGEHIYYVTHLTNSHIFRMKKDGGDNVTFVAQKAWSDISVYNDKLYFRATDSKGQLMCVDLDGKNEQRVGTIKPADYFISNGVVYSPDLSFKSGLANKLNFYNMADGSAGTTSDLGGTVLNVVGGFAFTYPLNSEKLQKHTLTRYDMKNNTAIKYENIPAVKNSALDRPTVNVANGMVYFGNKFGVLGRLPINGGSFESL